MGLNSVFSGKINMNVCDLLFVLLWGWEPGSWVSPQPFTPGPPLSLRSSRRALGIFSAKDHSPRQVSAVGELTGHREGMIKRENDASRSACSKDLLVLCREGSQHPFLLSSNQEKVQSD